MTNYSHSRCYANKTKNCSTKISGEHIISDNVLELFELNKTVKIAGLPWMEQQTFNLLSRKSLVANILCKNHNEALSAYDAEAGQLIRYIKMFDSDYNCNHPTNEHIKLNGYHIEKWMLKIVCGMIASKQIAYYGTKTTTVLKDVYIDLLFNNAIWNDGWGLYFKIPDNSVIHKYDCLSVMPLIGNNEVKGAEFLINNFKFYLLLGKPENSFLWGIHRINKIYFRHTNVLKTIEFNWNDKKYNKSVELNRIASTNIPPEEWNDWMKK